MYCNVDVAISCLFAKIQDWLIWLWTIRYIFRASVFALVDNNRNINYYWTAVRGGFDDCFSYAVSFLIWISIILLYIMIVFWTWITRNCSNMITSKFNFSNPKQASDHNYLYVHVENFNLQRDNLWIFFLMLAVKTSQNLTICYDWFGV